MSAIQCVWPLGTRSVLLAIFLFGTQAYAYNELTFTNIERIRTRTDDRERMMGNDRRCQSLPVE